MNKRTINPWTWQDEHNYVQAVDVSEVKGTLYCAGQAAVNADGTFSNADMPTQLKQAIHNLETVVSEAGYECRNIVRLTIFSLSSETFINECSEVFKEFALRHNMTQALSLIQVVALNSTLNVELEATVVK